MKTPAFVVALCISLMTYGQQKLDEVKVEGKSRSLQKSLSKTTNTAVVTSKELLKAACCNLAESFETNPSIDVNFSDALTGTKQIRMLGLTSPYILMAEENIPSVRGASQIYGLSFIPGTWVESIQITKGAGSVVNGYESISGQINTELIKPLNDIPFFLNAYADNGNRYELNTHFNVKLGKYWASSLFIHGNARVGKNDMNDDGFLDNPLGQQFNVTHRWQYTNPETGWVSFFNLKYLNDQKQMGEVDFHPQYHRGTTQQWGSEINTERFDVSTKSGYVFKGMPYQSLGFQNAFSYHHQSSYFGLREYAIKQQSLYSNFIFNSIIENTRNKFSTGINLTLDRYTEVLDATDYSRIDNAIGTFFEYTFDNGNSLSYILGGRVDYHNRLGVFFTPRFHLRYNPWEFGVVRLSMGRGKRAANIWAENQTLFNSSRQFVVQNSGGSLYGLDPEIAWNYGVSFTQKFRIFNKNAAFTIDAYRTDFQNQVVVDVMQNAQQVIFYNLQGRSYANTLQVDFDFEPIHRLNIRNSFKYYDVATDYLSGRFQRPLQAGHRFFSNVEYETARTEKNQQWKMDATYNWMGVQQLPYTGNNPASEQLGNFSPSYSLVNAQLTRVFSKSLEVYLGAENLFNYQQERAILGADAPFGPNFDATIIYAPVFGRMVYTGLRYKVL
ncbi:TonB-dependent receptor plug domain-containing protein [Flavobacterium sp.]|jgi:outer membrane receptor for ferrienterochelin and colicins|uniref:TonB-dependent receptor plug domain-containing protein n=1 Tax=Flavobacterium sp. TaxID=239 RepID=UPI0022C82458|nr:TonB-dependent receptor [Flavobacterium sp.]MCZ8143944.1 TonB-dependent receptor [Flavobacterium sp.]MCZ8367322.1 TonB-dependent receptor [Flavobacterium sp.]